MDSHKQGWSIKDRRVHQEDTWGWRNTHKLIAYQMAMAKRTL